MNLIFLQDAAGPGMLPMLLIMGVVIFFFMILPQRKRQKEEKKFREALTKGMRVVTNSGIHGKLLEIGDTFVIIESENSRLRLDKTAVSKDLSAQYLPKAEPKEKSKEKEK